MRNPWIWLVAIFLFSNGVQAFAGDEREVSKTKAKTQPNIPAESKAKTTRPKPDSAEMPVDPLEKKTETLRNQVRVKTEMPPDDFGKSMQKK